ncbi:hypothetical protein AN958_05535 [Leucoagaricus sp. SymC.cos]|nr:hypothetical protein AN958_05535 [Leucoagaricus sp. SymC.cos]
MEYRPRYAQPFTLSEAVGLDVSVITDEIARLRNSLKHLQETQEMLRDYQSTEAPGIADPEIQKALDENEVVIGSQTERISILKLALTEKGAIGSSHYDTVNDASTVNTRRDADQNNDLQQSPTRNQVHEGVDGEGEGGIHL